MDRRHLARVRLRTTLLGGTEPVLSPTDVVDGLVAVQAQEFALARWSVGQRCGVDDVEVSGLVDSAQLIRTHVLRPTWHFVRPTDLRWLQQLTGPRVRRSLGTYLRRLELDDGILARFCQASVDALSGGRSLTRDEMAQVAAEAGIVVDRMGLSFLLIHAELESLVCNGPAAVPAGRAKGATAGGRHHTYALVDERVPASASRSRREALAELTLRYFSGHGPATAKDFAWWSSLTLTDVRAGLDDVRDLLERADVEGRTYWGPPGWTSGPVPTDGVHLLQTFDEFVVGYGESRDVLDVAGIASMTGPEWGRDGHPVVIDGQVAGHWRRGAGAEAVNVVPRRVLTADERSKVAEAARRLAKFGGSAGSTPRPCP